MVEFHQLKLLLLDVDGVMTDGGIILDNNGNESKRFNVKDGHGIKLLQRAGIAVGIVTGRSSSVVVHRAAELGIEILCQGAKDKLVPFNEILAQTGLAASAVAYVGDDVVDLPILLRVGFSATVADAVDEVKNRVDYVAERNGGCGAVREICDHILRHSGRWPEIMERYLPATPATHSSPVPTGE
ncbi:MAG: HAD-IIIA family hydrolase [Desulfuromonadales bacterium]|nr:HAD-IIIA family hydrolase [Desulfuromonadales bacterium]MDT8423810.1 HAD-IIIA family hydrolase [Desulfuromonadales bacterium]